jgi:hypothetical protein
LQTAVISIADFVPSMKQVLVENVPQGVGRGAMIVRLVARPLAGRDHREAAGTRPVDMLADQRRLIAPGKAVHHAGGRRLAREERPRERVGFHIDHDNVLAVGDGAQRVPDARRWNSGRFDNHFNLKTSDQGRCIRRDMRAPPLACVSERCCGDRAFRPAGGAQLLLRARDVEIGDGHDVHAARGSRLREKHGAELAGSNHADGHRPSGGLALKQHGVEIHRGPRSSIRRVRPGRALSFRIAATQSGWQDLTGTWRA